MNNKFNKIYIMFSLLIFAIGVTLVDAFVHPPYFYKIIIKIILFLVLPCIYFIFNKKEIIYLKKMFKFNKKGIFSSVMLGLIIYIFIVGGYFIVRNFISFDSVVDSLKTGMGITKDNYIYVLLYISIINSLLEEFFFRGFGFMIFRKYTSNIFSYIYSPLLFAIYHIGMTIEMFNPLFTLFLIICLMNGGIVLNYLNDKYNNIYPSWLFHMAIDFGIHTVGLILFGII